MNQVSFSNESHNQIKYSSKSIDTANATAATTSADIFAKIIFKHRIFRNLIHRGICFDQFHFK